MTDCFADISTRAACTVTQKLDLDQMCKWGMRSPKDTYMLETYFLLQIWGLFASYDPILDDSDVACSCAHRMTRI